MKERKYGKPIVFKERIGNVDILVTSRDPKTRIQKFKEQGKKKRRTQQRDGGILSYW